MKGDVNMKKIILAVLCMFMLVGFCGCSKNDVTWSDLKQKSDLLVQNDWTVFHEDTNENATELSEEYDSMVKTIDAKYTIEIIHVLCLNKGDDYTCNFYELKTEEQPNYIYNLYKSREGNMRKLFISGKYVVDTNSDEAIQLLGYQFTL